MSDASFQAPPIESIAALFPAFDFDHLIAQGGMGAVYLARQRSLDRDVAIKILPRELGEDPLFRRSFEAEAKAMARVVHPNLITVYDSGDVDGLLYIVMEYIPGKSLFHSAHQKAVDSNQAVEIIVGICRGLAEAHNHGIVHRDIKPANILLTPKREPKIGDFGLARAPGHESDGLTMGTPGYAAPEVTNHPELADRRSDIFAVGVMLRELLTGRPPEDDPQPDRGITDKELLDICRKATAADPAERYQKPEEMVTALKTWLHEPDDVPKPAQRQSVVDRSASSALGRNIAIIIVLLAAIFVTWGLLQKKKAATAATAQKPAPAKVNPPKAKNPEPSSTPWPDPPSPSTPDTSSPTPPLIVEEKPSETPAQSLLRLRAALAAGEFGELPVGTRSYGDSHYFFVSRSMTWSESSRMARSFGGHLPLVTDEGFLTWMAEAIPADPANDSTKQATWIGATRTSPDLWQMVNAVPWPLDTPPQGDGDFASLHNDGSVRAESDSETHPFFIQWHRDGSNPTRIAQILINCKNSADSDQPFFPPGIETLGERSFLIVDETINYDGASSLAELGGGKLMTAASEEEADWLDNPSKKLSAPDGLWLGATLKDELWVWNSFQPWAFARWAPNSEPRSGDALLFLPGAGWAGADRSHQASGFIIEWSKDQLPQEAPTPPDLLGEMETRAKDLLAQIGAKRQKALEDNSEEYLWKLDIWLRRRGNNAEIARWTPGIQFLKAKVKNGRLPSDIPRSPNAAYPAEVQEIAYAHFLKQEAIDLGFTTTAETYRDAFSSRLKEEIDKANAIGQREKALEFSEKIIAASNIDAWIQAISGIVLENSDGLKIISASFGSRGKFADVTETVKEMIEAEQRSFRVLAAPFGIDPDPGWNKSLKIEFSFEGQTRTKWFNRNALVSPEVLIEVATVNSTAEPEE